MNLFVLGLLIAVYLATVSALAYSIRRSAKLNEQKKAAEHALEQNEKAARIRHRLNTDSDYAKRVRKTFER